jgi:hypothetical protein
MYRGTFNENARNLETRSSYDRSSFGSCLGGGPNRPVSVFRGRALSRRRHAQSELDQRWADHGQQLAARFRHSRALRCPDVGEGGIAQRYHYGRNNHQLSHPLASGATRPGVSTINFTQNDPALANGAIVGVSTNASDLSVYNSGGNVHVILDVTGYFQ